MSLGVDGLPLTRLGWEIVEVRVSWPRHLWPSDQNNESVVLQMKATISQFLHMTMYISNKQHSCYVICKGTKQSPACSHILTQISFPLF